MCTCVSVCVCLRSLSVGARLAGLFSSRRLRLVPLACSEGSLSAEWWDSFFDELRLPLSTLGRMCEMSN